MAMEITVMQGADVFAQIFNAVATFVKNETWHSLMKIAEIIGLFAVMILYVKGRDLKSIGMWLLTFVLINTLLLTPKERLIITDLSQPNIIKNVDNVPLGVALPIYFTTLVGNSIARTYDTFLAQPEDLQYSKTGLLFGQRLLENSFDIVPPTPELASNINEFVKICLIERNMISREFEWTSVKESTNLVDFFSKGKPADYMNYTYKNKPTTQVDCRTAGTQIRNDLTTISKNTNKGSAVYEFAKKLGADGILYSGSNVLPKVNSQLANAQNYFMGTSRSASDILVQNMLVNQFKRGISSYPVNLDVTSTLVNQASEASLQKMKLSHLSSYQVSGRLLPAFNTVLLALMVGLFPIMVLAMFIRELSWGIVKNYLAVLFSLMMWPVMFAIFNSIMNTIQYQTLNGQYFTLSNADNLKENATTMAGVAMWLTTAIPFIAFRLVTNLGQNLASAGSYLGNAMSSSTNADASQFGAGNYNWGNMQTHNYNANKVDLNHVYKQGTSMIQNKMGGMEITNQDGSLSYDAGTSLSKLPFSVNWSNSFQSSFNEKTSMAINQEARNSQGVKENVSNAISHLTGYNSGHTHSSMKGKDNADNYGITKTDSAGNSNSTSFKNASSEDDSYGTSSQNKVSISGNLKGGVSLAGSGGSAGVSADDSTSQTADHKYATSIGRQIDNMFNTGKSFAEIDGFIETIKRGTSDTNFITTLNNVQRDMRQAREEYNDYVESKSKSLSQVKEAILSETESSNVTHDLNSALYRHIKSNYSLEDQAKILTSAPTDEGMALRRQAIKEVTDNNVDSILGNYRSNKGMVEDNYNNTIIENTAGGSPSDISVNPNQSITPPSSVGYDTNISSDKKERLKSEFDNAKAESENRISVDKNLNLNKGLFIIEKGQNVGTASKTAISKTKELTDFFGNK